jgi:hypothetical protein
LELKSMKCDEKEPGPAEAMYGGPQQDYPYGLRICLDEECLAKLGVEKLPELGAEMMITAKVRVTRKSESEDMAEGEVERSLDLQITDMALGAGGK